MHSHWARHLLLLLFVLLLPAIPATILYGQSRQHLRARDLGIPFQGEPGPYNAITDVSGVEVGHATLIKDVVEPDTKVKSVRTGVSVIFPRGKDDLLGVPTAWFSYNGVGEMTGTSFLDEYGTLFGPVMITNTLSVGVVRDAFIEWSRDRIHDPVALVARVLPVVAETWDGYLNDIYGFHIHKEDVFAALNSARGGPVAEGNVGSGTGMRAFEFKAGIGTSSRLVRINTRCYTVGVLVQANFGTREQLCIAGVPVGQEISDSLPTGPGSGSSDGSIIVVIASDVPLLPFQLKRMAKRSVLALGRSGSEGMNTSGDLFIAFSTANSISFGDTSLQDYSFLPNELLNPVFTATVQATEEAIVNSLVAARTMVGNEGHKIFEMPHEQVIKILTRHHRLTENN